MMLLKAYLGTEGNSQFNVVAQLLILLEVNVLWVGEFTAAGEFGKLI